MTTEDGPTVRDRWIGEVLRTPHLTDAVRVALLALAHHEMDDAGIAEFRLNELGEWIGRHYKRGGDRISAAIAAGFLERISRGQRNGRGRYRATFPALASSDHPGSPKSDDVLGPPGESQEDSLRTTLQGEETSVLGTIRVVRRSSFDPNVLGPPGESEETAPTNKDHARTHSKRSPQPHTTHQTGSDHATGATVVRLFNEKNITTEKTHTARSRAAEPSPTADDAFDAFWSTYPRHVAKAAARKAWAKALKNGADPELIILGARRYATNPRRAADDIRYTAHPATWLNQERWTDEDEPAPAGRELAPTDRRQQATDDIFTHAMARARARDAQEGHR